MRNLVRSLFVLPAVAVLVGACASDDPNGGNSPGTTTVASAAQFETAYAEAACRALQPCCEKVGSKSNAACVEQTTAKIAKTASKPGYVFDATKASACVQAVQAATCAGSFYDTTSCRGVFSPPDGDKKPGEACDNNEDCAGGSSDQAVCLGTTEYTCSRVVRVGLGEQCFGLAPTADGNTYTGCTEGLRCDTMATKKCVKEREAGDACPDYDCGLDAQCKEGICVGRQAEGAACEQSYECASDTCKGGKCVLASPGAEFCK